MKKSANPTCRYVSANTSLIYWYIIDIVFSRLNWKKKKFLKQAQNKTFQIFMFQSLSECFSYEYNNTIKYEGGESGVPIQFIFWQNIEN